MIFVIVPKKAEELCDTCQQIGKLFVERPDVAIYWKTFIIATIFPIYSSECYWNLLSATSCKFMAVVNIINIEQSIIIQTRNKKES